MDSNPRIIQPRRRLPGLPDRPLPGAARGQLGVEVAGGKVLLHALASCLNEAGIVEYILDLVGRGVARDVLFPQHVPQMRALTDTVHDVLENFPLPFGALPVAEEDLVPKRLLLFLGHVPLLEPSLMVLSPSSPSVASR